ncbi:hypothetical protein [Streptacidiphilus cavernicola]|uniref:SurA N-terminal domain-containing protein n=1 Tax=Streptacidiphilus cavernicola TaxID=3342716 RepID=A0ABV6VN29_9ACTN
MNRRRTAAVALAVSAVAALSACSSTAHPGAAAVVGDQRITVSTLQSHLAAYRAAAAQDTTAQEQPGVQGNLLALLVNAQIVDQALADQGKSVSEGQVQQVEAQYAQQTGSAQALQQAIVEQLYIAPSDFPIFARYQVGEDLLLQQAGVDPSSSQAGAAFLKILQKEGSSLGVTVNPRYGSWSTVSTSSSAWPPLAAAKQPWLQRTAATPPATS